MYTYEDIKLQNQQDAFSAMYLCIARSVTDLCGRRVFLTHGHRYNADEPPAANLLDGAGCVVYGHFHVPLKRQVNGVWYLNPGSVSIPKEGSWHGCMRMTEDAVQWLDLDGNLKDELR